MTFGLPKRFFGKNQPPENPDLPQHTGTAHVPFKTWIATVSSNVQAVWYDPEEEILKIRYGKPGEGNRSYAYSMVPMSVFLGLVNAASNGEYAAKHIKWNYPYVQLGYLDG